MDALNQTTSTVSASLRTGNVIVDIMIGTLVAACFSFVMSHAALLWQRVEKWWSRRVRDATAIYKYKFTVKLNELQVSGADGHRNKMAVNNDNGILIEAIIRNLMNSGAVDKIHDQEIKNVLGDDVDQGTRSRHIESVISSFPQSNLVWNGMLFEFENTCTVNTAEKEPSVTRSEQIVIQSNDREATFAYLDSCKQAEITRLYPAPLVTAFKPYYWFIIGKPAAGAGYVFNRYPWSSAKTFDSLFFSRKAEVIATLDHFRNRTGPWSPEKQRTHTCNVFLSGPPGGGKTSAVKAIANYMDRHIFSINMQMVKSDEDMLDIVSRILVEYRNMRYTSYEQVPLDKRIYLLEDLDCAGCEHIIAPRDSATPARLSKSDDVELVLEGPKERGIKWTPNDTSLSGFLNALNGINELEGAMFIISTNHKEKFDPAIYRPGRMDIDLEMGRMTGTDVEDYLARYYGEPAPSSASASAGVHARHMPSRVEQICQSHPTAADAMIALAE